MAANIPETTNADLEDKLNKVESKVDLMIIRMDEMIKVYETAKGITVAVKWLAGVVAAGGILWTTIFNGRTPHG